LIADQFIKTVKGNRKGKINLEFDNPFTGKMFTAEDAITVGLIDSIGSFDQAVRRASELANQSQSSNNNSKDTNMKTMFSKSWGALVAFFAIPFVAGAETAEKEISAADWEKLNAELAEKNTLAQTVKDLEAAAVTATTAHETALAAVNKNLTDMTAERDQLTAKVASLGAQPGAMGTAPVKPNTDAIDASAEEGDGVADMDADHNKEAMEILKRP
jgi:ClpP class serine protease